MNIDNNVIPFLIIAILATSILIFFMVVVIITYTKRAKRKEKEYLNALMEDRERTYQQLSVELHDNITNMMTLARIHINDIEDNNNCKDIKAVKKVGQILDGLIKDTHHLSRGLNTDYITKYGIITIVTEELEWIQNSKKIKCSINVTGERKSIPGFKQLMIYRIVQEALMNSIKYSKAKEIKVDFYFEDNRNFGLKIADDGIGFNINAPTFRQGVGITSMYERAHQLGGKLIIDTRLQSGTTIKFEASNFWKR